MNVQYYPSQIDTLKRYKEVPLKGVEFETLTKCVICGAQDQELQDLAVLRDSLIISWCASCGHIFHRRRPTHAWILNWYAQHWDDRHEGKVKVAIKNSRFVLSGVKARFSGESVYRFVRDAFSSKEKMDVLEVGCGYGRELIPFRLSGHSLHAIEASSRRYRFTASLGVRVKNIPVEELSEKTFGKKFDLAFSNHVLEHVADPHIFMNRLTQVMKPGGWLALFVPNAESSFLLMDFLSAVHLQHFTESSITSLLKQYGFEIHRMQKDHQLSVLARFEKTPSRAIPLTESKATPLSSRALFENILGPHYREFQNREYFCQWVSPSPRIRSTYALQFNEKSDPSALREVKLRWTGSEDLPMRFEKFGDDTSVPFWCK